MAITRGKLADIQYIASSAGSVYANGAATKTFIGGIVLHNTNTTNEVVEIYNVPDSGGSLGTATSAHRFIKVTLTPDQTWVWRAPADGVCLSDTNDSIQADTTTASKVTIQLLGVKDV